MKIMLAFTVGWMFVIIYYLPRVTDDGNKVKTKSGLQSFQLHCLYINLKSKIKSFKVLNP